MTSQQNVEFLQGRVESYIDKINTNSEDWERRNEAVQELVRLFRAQDPHDVTVDVLRPLKFPLQAVLKDLRSTLVREACKLLETLAVIKADGCAKLVQELVPTLLELVASGNKVIKGCIGDCVVHLIHEIKFRSSVAFLCTQAMGHKSKETRDACHLYVREILLHWGSPYINPEANHLQSAISKGLEDGSAESRGHARESFARFVELFPERRDIIFNSVSLRTKKILASASSSAPSSAASNNSSNSSLSQAADAAAPAPAPVPDRAVNTAANRPPPAGGGADSSAPPSPVCSPSTSTSTSTAASSPSRIPSPASRRIPSLASRRTSSPASSPAGSASSVTVSPNRYSRIQPPRKAADRGRRSRSHTPTGTQSPVTPRPSGSPRLPRASDPLDRPSSHLSPGSSPASSPPARIPASQRDMSKALQTLEASEQELFEVGDLVRIMPLSVSTPTNMRLTNLTGTVRFFGKTKFALGVWVGVELDQPAGMHNGTLKDEFYFTCPDNHGVFVRPTQLERVNAETAKPPSPAERPSTAPVVPTASAAPAPAAAASDNASVHTASTTASTLTRGSKPSGQSGVVSSRGAGTRERDESFLNAHKKHVGEMLALLEKEMALIAKVEAVKGRADAFKARREHRQHVASIKVRQREIVDQILTTASV